MKALFYFLVIICFAMASCQEKTMFCGEVDEVPEMFSPDGDGHEDHWSFDIKHMDSWKVAIHNRWGQVQYEVRNEPVKWDGTMPDGEQAWVGTYVYTLKCQDGCGDMFERQGMVTLLR